MWHKSFATETNEVSASQIWTVLTDINNWKEWDKDIEWTEINGAASIRKDFILKPKGGPKTKLTITQFEKPYVFEDVAYLPLAKMYTIHSISETSNGIKIRVDVKIFGILSFFWGLVIGQNQIKGGPQQTKNLIEKAKSV